MMTTINEAVVALSGWVELSILGKATIMLAIGLTAVMLAGRARASVRHLLLTATLGTVLALPLIALTAPEVTLSVPVSRAVEPIRNVTAATQSVSPSPAAITTKVPLQPASKSFWSEVSWLTILRLVWIAGALLLLVQLAVNLRRLNRIRRDGLPWTERLDLMRALTAECGIRRQVEVLLHERSLAPLTYGFVRPAILLPYEAIDWNEGDLRRAIIHELEHVRRGDWIIQLASRVTCALYWFHPLVWVAFRWLNLQAERACDDAVVRSAERTEYAEQLVLLARRLSHAEAQPALGMANRSDLSKRVAALLDGRQRRGRAGLLASASALTVASIMLFAIAPVRAVTQSHKSSNDLLEVLTAVRDADVQATARRTQKRIASAIDRALVEAAEEGDISGVEELLNKGANVNAAIHGDGSPLIAAAREGRLEVVRLLLDRGADPNLAVTGDGNALIRAAGENRIDVVRLLLDRGADPNASVSGEGNALIAAASEGYVDVVTLLLDRGANIDQIVPGDENGLIQASGNGHLDVVKLFVSRGADVNARARVNEVYFLTVDGNDRTKSSRRGEIIVRDVENVKGAMSVSDGDKSKGVWRTPLSMARKNGHADVVAFLISAGARE